jgi:hypothetical protein
LITILSQLNELEPWGADVDNSFLEATTKDKVYIVGGPELGDLTRQKLTIYKALA